MFYSGLKIFGAALTIFFLVFFYACLLWTERKEKNFKAAAISATTVSFLYSFKIFLIGVAVLAGISIFLKYFR